MEKKTPTVLFSDSNYMVINKPAGMIVNNADTSSKHYTVQDWIEENFTLEKSHGETEFESRGGIVHRLDKETSGALIIALNESTFTNIQSQFKDRSVKKVYMALCHGRLGESGEINVPIGRLPWNRMRFGVIPDGRESYTKFKTLKHLYHRKGKAVEDLSLVELYPQTGRTHQIRVHMQYAGHPLFADSLYAGRKTYASDKKYLERHFLHASRIEFDSPTTKKRVVYEAPLTSELVAFLSSLT